MAIRNLRPIRFGEEHISNGKTGQVSASIVKIQQPDHFRLLNMIGAKWYYTIRDSIDALHILQDGSVDLSLKVHAKLPSSPLEGGLVGDSKLALFKEVKLNITELELKGYLLDSDLANLAGQESLKVLRLRCTNLSNAALTHLRNIPNLEVLDLGGNSINDQVFMTLSEIPSLKRVLLDGTAVSPKAVAEFMKRRPDVRVEGFEKCVVVQRESLVQAAMAGLEEAHRIDKEMGGADAVPERSALRREAEKIVREAEKIVGPYSIEVEDYEVGEKIVEKGSKGNPLAISSLKEYMWYNARYMNALMGRRTLHNLILIRQFDNWRKTLEGKKLIAKAQELPEEEQVRMFKELDRIVSLLTVENLRQIYKFEEYRMLHDVGVEAVFSRREGAAERIFGSDREALSRLPGSIVITVLGTSGERVEEDSYENLLRRIEDGEFIDKTEAKIEEWALKLKDLSYTTGHLVKEVLLWFKTPDGRRYEEKETEKMLGDPKSQKRWDDLNIKKESREEAARSSVQGMLCAEAVKRADEIPPEFSQQIREAAIQNPLKIIDFNGYAYQLINWLHTLSGVPTVQELIEAGAFNIWRGTPEGIEMEKQWDTLSEKAKHGHMDTALAFGMQTCEADIKRKLRSGDISIEEALRQILGKASGRYRVEPIHKKES